MATKSLHGVTLATRSDEMKKRAYDEIKKGGMHGTTRKHLQKTLNIDPTSEEDRERTWRLAAALAALEHDGAVVISNGFYYTRGE